MGSSTIGNDLGLSKADALGTALAVTVGVLATAVGVACTGGAVLTAGVGVKTVAGAALAAGVGVKVAAGDTAGAAGSLGAVLSS